MQTHHRGDVNTNLGGGTECRRAKCGRRGSSAGHRGMKFNPGPAHDSLCELGKPASCV